MENYLVLFTISVITIGLIIYGFLEYQLHQKYLKSIPVRIHVNGTRGKSSVTRLIGAGLRAGGYNTITKVTGTFPRIILDDNTEVAITRKEKANILEQLQILKYCAKKKADILVIECMALQPDYQRITEHQMIKATHGVLTNIRLDHLDVMGPRLKDVGDALSLTIPKKSKFFTAERRLLESLRSKTKKLGSELIVTNAEDVAPEEMEGFGYIEHPENISLALAVCADLNVDRGKALSAMKNCTPDDGALRMNTIKVDKYRIHFYNALAANDPESTHILWNSIQKIEGQNKQKIIILNARTDRRDRSFQLIHILSTLKIDLLLLTGEKVELVKNMAIKKGIALNKLVLIGQKSAEQQFKDILDKLEPESVIVAIGNMGAGGAELAKYFVEKSKSNS